jgi:hypothetical protein
MSLRRTVLVAGLVGGGLVAGFGLKSVLAEGIPATNPLYYAGTLAEGGTLVNGTRDVTVNLWSAQSGGTMLCQTLAAGQSTATVTNGRFRIALDSSCKPAINQNNSAWVEVIDGATSLGRTPIGAVPYAVEADHAVSATNATSAANASSGSTLATTISQIQGQVHPASGFHASVTSAAPVTTVVSDSETQIVFDSVDFDLASEYDHSSGMFTTVAGGVYLVECAIEYAVSGGSAGAIWQSNIYKSGTLAGSTTISTEGNFITPQQTLILKLVPGDTLICSTRQNSQASQTLYTAISVVSHFGAIRLY